MSVHPNRPINMRAPVHQPRPYPKHLRPRVITKDWTYTATVEDCGCLIRFTGDQPADLYLPSAQVLGEGWFCYVAAGLDEAWIHPTSPQTIDGVSKLAIGYDSGVIIICTGSDFVTLGRQAGPTIGQLELRLDQLEDHIFGDQV